MVEGLASGSRRLGAPLPNPRKATSYAWAIRKKCERKREEPMAIYITQGRYTSDAVKSLASGASHSKRG